MKPDYDLIVIGAGVFGSIMARNAVDKGLSVVVIDDRRPMNGSSPSGFLMKPSWMTFFNQKEINGLFDDLDKLYGVSPIKFKMWPLKKTVTAQHVNRSAVLEDPHVTYLEDTVTAINQGVVACKKGTYAARHIVVAAGIWSAQLIDVPGLYGKQGVSFLYPGEVEAFIKPWAPYKQVVAHASHLPNNFWIGDGTAIKTENWTQLREDETHSRCARSVKRTIHHKVLKQRGIRPFVKGGPKPCYYKRHDNIWVVTGGGKNGTIAAIWAANQFLNDIKAK